MDRAAIAEAFRRLCDDGREGFTLGVDGEEFAPTAGFAVGCRRYPDFESALMDICPGLFLGWWKHEGVEYVELVQVFEKKEEAMLTAYLRGEIAIYDFGEDTVIDLSHFYTE
jgi:hypothetical protein